MLVAGAVAALAGLALGASAYNDQAARTEAKRLLTLVALPAGAQPSADEPAGAGVALAYSPGGPVVPHLVDLHDFFVVPGTLDSVVDWVDIHRPTGSSAGDSGSDSGPGEKVRWTSFEFGSIPGVLRLRELDVSAEQLRSGVVAVRVDSQVAPLPKLPGNARGPGGVRVVEVGTMQGSFGFELSCDPAGGTVPHAARICAAVLANPALLYSFPGPDHSCPGGSPAVSIDGTWNHERLESTFSECTGGQEQQAAEWAAMLPSQSTDAAVHTDQGIGLIRLGETEHVVVDLLRGASAPPASCEACTRTFSAGFSIGYGPGRAQPAGWTITLSRQQVVAIESNVPGLTINGAYASRGFTSLRKKLHGWSTRTCSQTHELVHSSVTGTTMVVYGSNFERLVVTTEPASCI
ncbi:MAG: hypothetical protein ACLP8S_31860 [Solirubrobacteraceae bacterium]